MIPPLRQYLPTLVLCVSLTLSVCCPSHAQFETPPQAFILLTQRQAFDLAKLEAEQFVGDVYRARSKFFQNPAGSESSEEGRQSLTSVVRMKS